jgi:POT family proton-dependent oligopeptide transporter
MVLIPLFSRWIYPAVNRFWRLTELRKIGAGMFVTVLAFSIPTWIQMQIDQGAAPSIAWQLLAYVVLTSAEVMVSITCLEFSYTQAPRSMKSFVMAFFMLSIAAGNLFTAAVNFFILNEDGGSRLAGAAYYQFFTIIMLVTAIVFVVVARFYRGDTILQEEVAEALPGRD